MTVLVAFMLVAVVAMTATEAVLSRSWLAAATVALLGLAAVGAVLVIAASVGAA